MSLNSIAALVAVIGGVASGVWVLEDRHAPRSDVIEIGAAFQSFVTDFQLREARKRLWQLEDKFGEGCVRASPEVKAECRALILEIDHMAKQSLKNYRRTSKP